MTLYYLYLSLIYLYHIPNTKRKKLKSGSLNSDFDDEILIKYKCHIQDEIEAICQEALELLTQNLSKIFTGKKDEREVHYLKMSADFYKCLSEIRTSNDEFKAKAKEYYSKAVEICDEALYETHPTRLNLKLSYGLFYHEILSDSEQATIIMAKSFMGALEKLDCIGTAASYKEVTLIMQQMMDNAQKWSQDNSKEDANKLVNGYINRTQKEYKDIIVSKDVATCCVDFYFIDLEKLWKELVY